MTTKTPINFDAHNKLSDKFGLKLFFSLFWRQILFQYLPLIIASLLPLFFLRDLTPEQLLTLIMIGGFSAYVLAILLTNQYIINSLVRIKYKNFSVYLAKDNHFVDKLGFYDGLCWLGSFLWRQFVLGIAYGVVSVGIGELQLFSKSLMTNVDRAMQIVVIMLAFIWVLKTKKTGRLILLQPIKIR